MKNKAIALFLPFLLTVLLTLACGNVKVGVVTPTAEKEPVPIEVVQGLTPEVVVGGDQDLPTTDEVSGQAPEIFSFLWVEYWNPVFNYGLALPAHWEVTTEEEGGFMVAKSYDMAYFQANSMKGGWIGGEAPEGAVKLDFAPLEVESPEQSLGVATGEMYDVRESVLLSVEGTKFGAAEAAFVAVAPSHNLEDSSTHIALRLSPDTILSVAAYPNTALTSDDVQLILNSLVLDKNNPIIKPTTAPHPPLTVINQDISGQPTASYASAWYGHIASLPEGDPYDDKVVSPFGAGEFGIKGRTSEIEGRIQSLRDSAGGTEYVHLWGVLYCNIDDYYSCQLKVEPLEYEGEYTIASTPIDKWVGTIQRINVSGESTYVFVLSGKIPVWYGIAAPNDLVIQDQIEALADSDTIVNVWGDLLVGVNDINGTRIEVNRIDPPAPGALPSSSACEPGYPGSVDEILEFIRYNLETGNHWPFSYVIGDPFVIGYWLSEGVTVPRDQAYQLLTEYYLPSPDEVVVITDRMEYPDSYDLYGMSIEIVWTGC